MGGNGGAICAAFALIYFGIGGVQPLFLDGSLKLTGLTTVRTMQLLNQLCNESQDNKEMNRDACYGCFFRATTSHQSGYPLLVSMANCADNYLNNTDFGHCAEYLKNSTTNSNKSANPTLVYCSFLECVRQVNKDNLSDARRIIEQMRGKVTEISDRNTINYLEKSFDRLVETHKTDRYIRYIGRRVCILRTVPTNTDAIKPGTEALNTRHTNTYD